MTNTKSHSQNLVFFLEQDPTLLVQFLSHFLERKNGENPRKLKKTKENEENQKLEKHKKNIRKTRKTHKITAQKRMEEDPSLLGGFSSKFMEKAGRKNQKVMKKKEPQSKKTAKREREEKIQKQ